MNRTSPASAALRALSEHDFLGFGTGHVAYLKPAESGGYALYAANGTLLTLQDSRDLAVMAARHNGLETVTVQ